MFECIYIHNCTEKVLGGGVECTAITFLIANCFVLNAFCVWKAGLGGDKTISDK